MRRIGWAIGLVLAGGAALEKAPLPWVWIGLGSFVPLVLASVRSSGRVRRQLWLAAASAVLFATAAEAWFGVHGAERLEGYDPGKYFRDDDILGYALQPSQTVRARRVVGDETVYDAVYTIDRRGLRVEPPVAPGGEERCVLFFGGSFTFGEGVNDADTLPFRTGVRAGGRLRSLNFGLHGYGPHQMLAALEDGVVDQSLEGCVPVAAIYQGVWFHAFRSAGRETWDRHGPRYVLDAQGVPVRHGHFDDDARLRLRRVVLEGLRRSYLFRAVADPRRRPSEVDRALYVAIIKRARDIFETRWPGARFHVIYWDETWVPLEASLEARGLHVHRVTRILPDWHGHRDRYALHPLDGHPNASACDRLAEYVVGEILPAPSP